MELLSLVYRQYRWPFIAITLLSLLSAVSGIGVIAFINQSLVESVGDPLPVLGQLIGLILLLLVITLGSQLALTTLGHHFVYRLRGRLLKQLLESGQDNGCFGDELANRYREEMLAGELQYWDEAYFAGEARDSLAKQRERERSDSLSFDDFLADYFGTRQTTA